MMRRRRSSPRCSPSVMASGDGRGDSFRARSLAILGGAAMGQFMLGSSSMNTVSCRKRARRGPRRHRWGSAVPSCVLVCPSRGRQPTARPPAASSEARMAPPPADGPQTWAVLDGLGDGSARAGRGALPTEVSRQSRHQAGQIAGHRPGGTGRDLRDDRGQGPRSGPPPRTSPAAVQLAPRPAQLARSAVAAAPARGR